MEKNYLDAHGLEVLSEYVNNKLTVIQEFPSSPVNNQIIYKDGDIYQYNAEKDIWIIRAYNAVTVDRLIGDFVNVSLINHPTEEEIAASASEIWG